MYVPPFSAILQNLGVSKTKFDSVDSITVPVELFKSLMQIALANSDFNEVTYLALNPDVEMAARDRTVESPRLHYIGHGYFEGRQGGLPNVDEEWYLRTYSDVADAVRQRVTPSAKQHFLKVGADELRAPSEAYVGDAVQWGKAFGKG
jgi:hypothetical protein